MNICSKIDLPYRGKSLNYIKIIGGNNYDEM
jgi:hypothetical protein